MGGVKWEEEEVGVSVLPTLKHIFKMTRVELKQIVQNILTQIWQIKWLINKSTFLITW